MLKVRGDMGLGCDLSFLKGLDAHLLSMEDLSLLDPSVDSSGGSGHGEDHGGNLLI